MTATITSGPPWYLGDVADALADALASLEQALRAEHAPHGLDEWDERPVQHALAAALRRHYEVTLEAHYPSSAGAKRSHRARCDLVLSRPGRPLHQGESLPLDLCPPEEALWLELKVVHQRKAGGARDPRYAPQWRRHLVADVTKLSTEPRITAGAAVLVAFTEDAATLARDLDAFELELTRQDVVAGFRQVRTWPVQDRIGHTLGAVAAWPTIPASPVAVIAPAALAPAAVPA